MGEVLLKNNYHLAGTEDALIQGPPSSYQLWSASNMFSLNEQTQNLFQDCVANNYGNGVTLIERGQGFVEFIHICSDSGHESVNPYLVHHVDQLWRYVLYIRESVQSDVSLKLAYDRRYQYHCQPLFAKDRVLNSEDVILNSVRKYYLGGRFDGIYFTKREIDCLVLLSQNKPAKEQAIILNLSHRTIEHLIERIKIKSGFKNKTELILALMSNHSFQGLLRHHTLKKR